MQSFSVQMFGSKKIICPKCGKKVKLEAIAEQEATFRRYNGMFGTPVRDFVTGCIDHTIDWKGLFGWHADHDRSCCVCGSTYKSLPPPRLSDEELMKMIKR